MPKVPTIPRKPRAPRIPRVPLLAAVNDGPPMGLMRALIRRLLNAPILWESQGDKETNDWLAQYGCINFVIRDNLDAAVERANKEMHSGYTPALTNLDYNKSTGEFTLKCYILLPRSRRYNINCHGLAVESNGHWSVIFDSREIKRISPGRPTYLLPDDKRIPTAIRNAEKPKRIRRHAPAEPVREAA